MDMRSSSASTINICLVGCVSAGKSTILNAFFGQDYAQCKIKRTTMMPNKFIETDDPTRIDSFESINTQISTVNDAIYKQTNSTTIPLNLDNFGGELTFHVSNMEMNMGKKIKLCIYDIPGLNDAKTKQVYYDYLRKNFHKFNIILFVVDIQSGLNTSDEIDILNFLSDNIKKHKTESQKNINMLTIVNKADDMQLNPGDKLEVLGELGEMFEQTLNTIRQTFRKKGIESNSVDCIPICGLDAHLYRMIKKYKDINRISREHILRIGTNEEGSKFRRCSEIEQREKISKIIRNDSFVDSMIKMSGFSQIEHCLNKFIGVKGVSMVIENIMWEYEKIQELTLDNMIDCLSKRINLLCNLLIHDIAKYEEEMKKLVKQFNTLVYKQINVYKSPTVIKHYYDAIVRTINSNNLLKTNISKFLSLTTYPGYFTDRILELVIGEFSEQAVPVSKLEYIELFENIGNLKVEIIDVILDALMCNSKGTHTFIFENSGPGYWQKIIKLLEKTKESDKFIEFLRFFLANIYTTNSKPSELLSKKLLFRKYEEIPMYEFLGDLRTEKMLTHIDTNKQYKIYVQGFTNNSNKDNLIELYYISKCRERVDLENFVNHDRAITVDFSMIY